MAEAEDFSFSSDDNLSMSSDMFSFLGDPANHSLDSSLASMDLDFRDLELYV